MAKEKGIQNDPSKSAENKMCYNYGDMFGMPQKRTKQKYIWMMLVLMITFLKIFDNPQLTVPG